MHQAIATLPDGTTIVLGTFDSHKQAHEYINNITLGAS